MYAELVGGLNGLPPQLVLAIELVVVCSLGLLFLLRFGALASSSSSSSPSSLPTCRC